MNEIRNCEFKFKCPMEWEALERTDNQDERYCGQCNRIVYFCHTPEALMSAMRQDLCVAIADNGPDDDTFVVGMPESIYKADL